jgi:hypothetical protein
MIPTFLDLPLINLECGPPEDRRRLTFRLDFLRRRVGVLVSGGLDSALLYYLLVRLNHENNWSHEITPYTILRKEGSPEFAPLVINYIDSLFGLPKRELSIVGDNTLPENKQVESGVVEILKNQGIVYLGLIENLEIHTVGWNTPTIWKDSEIRKYPLKHLNKSHIIDLIYQCNQEYLFEITHSCIFPSGRCNECNGCNERNWGFMQLGKTDPGKR